MRANVTTSLTECFCCYFGVSLMKSAEILKGIDEFVEMNARRLGIHSLIRTHRTTLYARQQKNNNNKSEQKKIYIVWTRTLRLLYTASHTHHGQQSTEFWACRFVQLSRIWMCINGTHMCAYRHTCGHAYTQRACACICFVSVLMPFRFGLIHTAEQRKRGIGIRRRRGSN